VYKISRTARVNAHTLDLALQITTDELELDDLGTHWWRHTACGHRRCHSPPGNVDVLRWEGDALLRSYDKQVNGLCATASSPRTPVQCLRVHENQRCGGIAHRSAPVGGSWSTTQFNFLFKPFEGISPKKT